MPSLNTAPSRVPLPDRDEVEQFLFREARLLDERQFDAWRELFAEDGLYWAPTRHAQASPDEAVSLFLDDRTTMAARIRRRRVSVTSASMSSRRSGSPPRNLTRTAPRRANSPSTPRCCSVVSCGSSRFGQLQ